jgi:signal transduction histidine kinase
MTISTWPPRIAWTVAAVALILNPVTALLGMSRGASIGDVGPFDVSKLEFLLGMPIFALVGAVIASRRPANLVWMVLSGIAVSGTLQLFTTEWAIFALLRHHGIPGGAAAAWVSNWMYPAGAALPGVLLLIFPDGRPLSKRWRWILWLVPVSAVLGVVVTGLHPGWSGNDSPEAAAPISNPLGAPSLAPILSPLLDVSMGLVPVIFVAGIVAMVLRFRRSSDEVRHQIKGFTMAAALLPVTVGLYDLSFGVYGGKVPLLTVLLLVIGSAAVLGTPLAIGVAIFKYRLYDIDVVINRALVYGALAAFITTVYVAIVVGIGALVGSGAQPNLVLSIVATAIVAVAFQPVRERLQKIANRLVYGQRATPYEVLSQFSERVAESYAADDVLPRMARVLAHGTGAARADVWLRAGDILRQAASWPLDSASARPARVVGDSLPEMPETDRAVEVRHQNELLGALTVTKRKGESLTPVEEKLLTDLAAQAGLVLKNVGLTAELLARLEDLRASRQRLVAAQDDERRRLERNLHDGAQQNLVALKVKLGLAEMFAETDPARAKQTLAELKVATDEALETLRRWRLPFTSAALRRYRTSRSMPPLKARW